MNKTKRLQQVEVRKGWPAASCQNPAKPGNVFPMDSAPKLPNMKDVDTGARERVGRSLGERISRATARVSDVPAEAACGAGSRASSKAVDKPCPAGGTGQQWQHMGSSRDATWLNAVSTGESGMAAFRLVVQRDGKDVSPWHSIPLRLGTDKAVNCMCKTPAGSVVQHELAETEPSTPLRVSATPSGRPAKYAHSCGWNVAVLPQTLADEALALPLPFGTFSDLAFDGCPLEVMEIGEVVRKRTGSVYPVKPLAAFLVLDGGGCLAWKLVAIATDDPLADLLHNVADLNTVMPDLLTNVRDWLRVRLCTHSGALPSSFPLGERPVDVHEAGRVVAQAHQAWYRKFGRDGNPPVADKLSTSGVQTPPGPVEQHEGAPTPRRPGGPGRNSTPPTLSLPSTSSQDSSSSTSALSSPRSCKPPPTNLWRSSSGVPLRAHTFSGGADPRCAVLPPGRPQALSSVKDSRESSTKKGGFFGLGKVFDGRKDGGSSKAQKPSASRQDTSPELKAHPSTNPKPKSGDSNSGTKLEQTPSVAAGFAATAGFRHRRASMEFRGNRPSGLEARTSSVEGQRREMRARLAAQQGSTRGIPQSQQAQSKEGWQGKA